MALAPDKIRNIMLAGHSSSGKTTLAEALLFTTKSTDRLGSVLDGNTVMDYDPEEIKRKTSIGAAVSYYDHAGHRVNVIDTPGLFDFALGTYEGIMAAETVLITVSGHDGIAVGTEKAWKLAKDYGKSCMFYISKLDAEHCDFDAVISSLREEFGAAVCPIVVPIKAEGKDTVYVDLINQKAFTFKDGKSSPAEYDPDEVMEYDMSLREQVAETDDALMEKFFMEEPFTKDELVNGIRNAMVQGLIAPVVCGDSVDRAGIELVLNAIDSFVPAPTTASVKAVNKAGEEVDLKIDANGPLAAYVFKTIADPFVGKLSYIKVISGTLTADASLVIGTTGDSVKLGKLTSIKGKKQVDVQSLCAGDIGAVSKLTDVKTGDTLCAPELAVAIKPVTFPKATLKMAIYTKNKGDEGKIAQAIQKMLEEDRTLQYYVNTETSQQILAGLGDQHLDVVSSKIKSKFGVDIGLEVPRIAYRESIRGTAEAEGKHKKQSGGAGQFGVVNIKFEPLYEEGKDFEFVNAVVGGAVPKEFIPAVEKGLKEALVHGVLAGYPMVGIKATLFDGKYHPVDSKEVAFKSAARLAYKAACVQAKPCILEPIDSVKILIPNDNTGDIMGDVTKRRGRVLGMNPVGAGLQEVEAEIPEAEMQDFSTYIRSSTQGRGSYEQEFLRYEQLPSNLEQKVIDEAEKIEDDED